MTDEPTKVISFFNAARDARREGLLREAISPSREQPKFRELYGSVNKPYTTIRDLKNTDYGSMNDGPGAA